jgi:hypothetical protein
MTESQILALLRKSATATGSLSAWARAAGVSPQFAHDVLRGRRPPSDAITRPLGYERVVTVRYRKIERKPE